MDYQQSLLALAVLLLPLVSALVIVVAPLMTQRHIAPQLAKFAAAGAFCLAVVSLVRGRGITAENSSSMFLGTWLSGDAANPWRIVWDLRLDALAALLAAVMSVAALCAFVWFEDDDEYVSRTMERFGHPSALLLLFSSIGLVISTHLGEMF